MTDHDTPLQLRRFVRRTNEGMQRPPIFEASDDNEYVLKLDTADPSFPVAEVVAAVLAGALDVPIPDFALLDVPDVLTAALRTTGDADQLEFAEAFDRLETRCFGSRYLEGTPTKWTSRLHRGIAGGNEVLARVIVFDAFIENMDRSSSTNPNLLVTRGQLYAIDHGQALPSSRACRWPGPSRSTATSPGRPSSVIQPCSRPRPRRYARFPTQRSTPRSARSPPRGGEFPIVRTWCVKP